MNMLASMTWMQWMLAWIMIFVSGILILVVLVQRGRGGGLTGAFGGAGGTAAFGAKTGDVFTWITVSGAAIFTLLAVVGNFAFDQSPQATPDAPELTTTQEPVPAEGGLEKLGVQTQTIDLGSGGKLEIGGRPIKVEMTPDGQMVPVQPGAQPAAPQTPPPQPSEQPAAKESGDGAKPEDVKADDAGEPQTDDKPKDDGGSQPSP